MGLDINQARAVHFSRMQQALEEGLRAIETARSPVEVDAARQRARRRLAELNREWTASIGSEDAGA